MLTIDFYTFLQHPCTPLITPSKPSPPLLRRSSSSSSLLSTATSDAASLAPSYTTNSSTTSSTYLYTEPSPIFSRPASLRTTSSLTTLASSSSSHSSFTACTQSLASFFSPSSPTPCTLTLKEEEEDLVDSFLGDLTNLSRYDHPSPAELVLRQEAARLWNVEQRLRLTEEKERELAREQERKKKIAGGSLWFEDSREED